MLLSVCVKAFSEIVSTLKLQKLIKNEIKMFLDIQKLKELLSSRFMLKKKMLSNIIQAEGNGCRWKSGSPQRNEEHLK